MNVSLAADLSCQEGVGLAPFDPLPIPRHWKISSNTLQRITKTVRVPGPLETELLTLPDLRLSCLVGVLV